MIRSPLGWLIGFTMLIAGVLAARSGAAQDIVHFPSLDDPHTMLDLYLYRPQGEGRHPAIVFLHGCSGMFFQNRLSALQFAWAYLLTSHGYVVLMVDSFGPRRHGEMCSIGGFDLGIFRVRPKDAYGALAYLQNRDDVRPARVAAIGWSQGGGTMLLSVSRRAKQLAADFAAPNPPA